MGKSADIIDRGISKRTGKQMWLVRVDLGIDAAGKRQYASRLIHGGIREAERVQREMAVQRDKQELARPGKETLVNYLQRWLETHRASVKPRTYLNDCETIDRYILPHLGATRLDKLSPMVIQGAYAVLQERGLSASTVRRAHAVLRNALQWAVQWQVLQSNPAARVILPKTQKREMRPLNLDEVRRFLDACAFDAYGTLFQFLIFTGCRPGEAFALRWRDVDLDRKEVYVRRTYAKKAGQELISTPKTARGARTIPILDTNLLQELRDERTKRIESCLAGGNSFDAESLVFTSSTGTPVHSRNLIQRHFKPLLERAGIPNTVRLYDLRHTTATLLLALGVHPKIVQEMLGHADIALTMNTYTHGLPTLQKESAQKLADLLSD